MPLPSPARARARALAALGAVLTATAFAAAPAHAGTPVLTTPTGTVGVGDSLSTVGATTFQFGHDDGIKITCGKVGVVVMVVTNPTAPGDADLAISSLTVSGCTISGTTDTPHSITLSGTGTAVVSDGTPLEVAVTSVDVAIALTSGLGTSTCAFGDTTSTAAFVGIIVNPASGATGGSITFTNQILPLLSGTSVCGTSGVLNGVFSTPLDGAQPVYVN